MPREWHDIATLAPKIMVENSKDLEVVCWYLEALVRIHGFAGLRDGFALAQGLVDRFWDTFNSLPADEEGLVTRLMPFTGLNGAGGGGTLLMPINNAPITRQAGDLGPYSYFNYEKASELAQRDPEVRAKRAAHGEVTLENFTAAVTASGGQFYVDLIGDIDGALTNFNALTASLEAKAGAELAAVVGDPRAVRNHPAQCPRFLRGAGRVGRAAACALRGGLQRRGARADGGERRAGPRRRRSESRRRPAPVAATGRILPYLGAAIAGFEHARGDRATGADVVLRPSRRAATGQGGVALGADQRRYQTPTRGLMRPSF